MKKCELCNSFVARIVCKSDKATLCWECDYRVHAANFLVAKHSRTLLCHCCQSLTQWNCSGRKLPLTVTVCEYCVDNSSSIINEDDQDHGNISEDEVGSGNGEVDDENDGDNQVVPLSPITSSS
ncbi:hypothetical protein Leryth_018405 [Lithospermum erythrorhizon]|uniref:B box-type domain-containing protein n=1 Tax=Lithospermum erythrorhizon TaxID=34254 RepID=A0AAV3QR93_LITER|nr:hypothetical protein Leryth_018405 [Lithospermum erythrorhizon]